MEWLPGKKTKHYESCSLRKTGVRINPHDYVGLNGRHDKQRFLILRKPVLILLVANLVLTVTVLFLMCTRSKNGKTRRHPGS